MKILVLSGAGLSAPSGIATFRDGGLWNDYEISQVATHEAWLRNPKKVIDFYDQRRYELGYHQPNEAHHFLAKISSVHLTQNIDDLSQRAGGDPIHLHGKLTEIRCEECKKIWDIGYTPQPRICPWCGSSNVRPNVVLFGEMAPNYRYLYTTEADCFLAIGTSGRVIDVADLAQTFPCSILVDPKRHKRVTMFGEFDQYIDEYFTHFIQKSVTEAMEEIENIIRSYHG